MNLASCSVDSEFVVGSSVVFDKIAAVAVVAIVVGSVGRTVGEPFAGSAAVEPVAEVADMIVVLVVAVVVGNDLRPISG